MHKNQVRTESEVPYTNSARNAIQQNCNVFSLIQMQ